MSKFETIDFRNPLEAQQTWANIEEGKLVVISNQDFEVNDEYESLVNAQFEDPNIGILVTDCTVKRHGSLMNNYTGYNSIELGKPFIVRKVNMPLPNDKRELLVGYKNNSLKFQHLAEPVFNVS